MKPYFWISVVIPAMSLALAGCQKTTNGARDKEYEVKGKVVQIAADKSSVTLDHEDIPGLMKGMEMDFPVENPKILAGLRVGDLVEGKLAVKADNRKVITSLKRSETAPEDEEAEVKAARDQLNPDERGLVDAQDICPISGERLGSMGMPVKVPIKDEPVYLCCKNCRAKALAKPEQTLVKVNQIKQKVAGLKK